MKPRNPHALPARRRKAGPMKHKNAPRGGERQAAYGCRCLVLPGGRTERVVGCPASVHLA